MLSQLPLEEGGKTATEEPIFHTTVLEEVLVMAEQTAELTGKDPVLSKVWTNTVNRWPNHVSDAELQPYFKETGDRSSQLREVWFCAVFARSFPHC